MPGCLWRLLRNRPSTGTGSANGSVSPVNPSKLGSWADDKGIIISMGLGNADAARAAFERGDYDTGFAAFLALLAPWSVGKSTSARGASPCDSADDAFAGVKRPEKGPG